MWRGRTTNGLLNMLRRFWANQSKIYKDFLKVWIIFYETETNSLKKIPSITFLNSVANHWGGFLRSYEPRCLGDLSELTLWCLPVKTKVQKTDYKMSILLHPVFLSCCFIQLIQEPTVKKKYDYILKLETKEKHKPGYKHEFIMNDGCDANSTWVHLKCTLIM